MVSLQKFPAVHHAYLLNASPQVKLLKNSHNQRRSGFLIRSELVSEASISFCQDRLGRRQFLATGPTIVPLMLMFYRTPTSFAAENKKGFLPVTDKKDGYSFVYPFGWQEVVIAGQDKAFKDVIEPLESVGVNVIPTGKQDLHDFGSPEQVAETLIKKFLASSSQKTKLIEASERDVEGKAYYTFEFTAQAPNFTRHALTAVCIGNGKFYTLTTGANERRWEKMKDRLHTVVDSFQVFNV